MAIALIICTLAFDLRTSVSPLIFFELVEMHCLNRVMQRFDFKQYILFDIDTSNQLNFISRSSMHTDYNRHTDYNWMIHHP